MKKIKKYIAILTLFNIIIVSLLIVPQQKAHAALPVIVGQAIKESAERAMLKVVRKAGYKAMSSPTARAEVMSIYSRLSPAGKEAFDTAMATAVKANNLPGWAKLILPATLIGEIGLIATGLTSDSANGIPIDYNEEVPAGAPLEIYRGMPETIVRDGLQTKQIASFDYTWNGMNVHLNERVTGQKFAVDYRQAAMAGMFMSKFVVDDYAEPNFILWVYNYNPMNNNTSRYGVIADQPTIAGIVQSLTDVMVVMTTSKIDGLTAEEGAVTGESNATDMEVTVPITEEEPMTFADYWGQVNENPDYAPDGAEFEEPVTEPETKPVESEWWKWLTAPLEKILELLKTLFDWLKSTFGQIPEWFSSILSKLADLLGAVGDIFGKLGEWSFVEWWANLFGKLGEMLDTIKLNALDLWNWLGQLLDGILALPETMWDWFWTNLVGNPTDVNMDKLKSTGTFFTTKFPFSLPWDIQKGLEAVFSGVGSELPTWHYPIMGHTFEIKIPSLFESWGVYIRGFMLIMFDIGLVYSVRKLLGGAS